ncbi:MAG: YcjX family protein [Desulfohalobiaceae bacterium]
MKKIMDLRKNRNIAVTGIAGGGKTVFLTSLISHLMEFGNGYFHPGRGVDITDFREIPSKKAWPPRFEHSAFREDLARGSWPEKSKDCSEYICEFRRSDRMLGRQRLTFFDFPGERVADAAIAAYSKYEDWSEHILKHFENQYDYARITAPYLQYVQQENVSLDGVLALYKETLAKLILDFKPLISPSTFLLDKNGQLAEPGQVTEISQARYAGISKDEQFAPLPREVCRKYPRMAARMSTLYKKYRKNVVLPMFEKISNSDTLVVLVDIPSLLLGGAGRYNDNRQILLDLFELLRPDSHVGSQILSYLKLWQNSLARIAFVAAKADMVHPMDVENKRMLSLLKMITDRPARMLPKVQKEWFVCSACYSTYPAEGVRRLQGKLARNNPENKFMGYNVSELPAKWPESWRLGAYHFYKINPDAPENYLFPPRHQGLDQIFEFISK